MQVFCVENSCSGNITIVYRIFSYSEQRLFKPRYFTFKWFDGRVKGSSNLVPRALFPGFGGGGGEKRPGDEVEGVGNGTRETYARL